LIIYHSESKCKSDFGDRAKVMQRAEEVTRRGEASCPLCGAGLRVHGCYRRHMRDGDGKRHYGWVAQAHCADCGSYPALIPDFLMPHKHYEAVVIEAVITESEREGEPVLSGCPADESTMRRWLRQFAERGARAVGWLGCVLCELYDRHVSALELQGKALLKQLARLLREIRPCGGIIGGVNVILTRHNHGFL